MRSQVICCKHVELSTEGTADDPGDSGQVSQASPGGWIRWGARDGDQRRNLDVRDLPAAAMRCPARLIRCCVGTVCWRWELDDVEGGTYECNSSDKRRISYVGCHVEVSHVGSESKPNIERDGTPVGTSGKVYFCAGSSFLWYW